MISCSKKFVCSLGKEDVGFVNKSIEGADINDIDKKIRNAVDKLLNNWGHLYLEIDYYSTINEKGNGDLSGPFTKISVCTKPKDLKTVIPKIVDISIRNTVFRKEFDEKRKKFSLKIYEKFEKKLKKFREKEFKRFSKEKRRLKNFYEKIYPEELLKHTLIPKIEAFGKEIQKSIEEKERDLDIKAAIEKEEKKVKLSKKIHKKIEKEFLGNSYFDGICAALGLQRILEGKMEPNSHVRSLQRYLGLFVLEMARKNSVKDFKNVKFQDNFSHKVIEKFKEFLNENFGIDVAAVNGSNGKYVEFNDTITRDKIEKDFFKEDHNLIILSKEDCLFKDTHVIYFNPQKREIADGADGRIIEIPKEYDEVEFLKEYLLEEYSNKKITVLSLEKQPNAPADIKFSSLEKIILWILRYWNLILHTIEKNFYKENLEYKYYELKDITEEDEKNLEDNLSGEIKSKDGKTVK